MRAFISCTSEDLKEYREAAAQACSQRDMVPVHMGLFPAMGPAATESSLGKMAGADVYIGIVAERYGYIEPGHDISVTHEEYRHAGAMGIDRLCFLHDEEHEWPPKHFDRGYWQELSAFKAEIELHGVRDLFTDINDFRVRLGTALDEWRLRSTRGEPAARPEPPTGESRDLLELSSFLRDVGLGILLDAYADAARSRDAAITRGLRSLSDMLLRLPSLLVGEIGLPPLLQFAIRLESHIDPSYVADFVRWVEDYADRMGIGGPLLERERADVRRHAPPAVSRLVIRIEEPEGHEGTRRYALAAERHGDTDVVDRLDAGDEDELYSIDDIRGIVSTSLHEWATCCAGDPRVEFLVPRHLLGTDFDQWPIVVPRHSHRPRLGVRHSVVLRDLDRTLRPDEPNPQWRRRWTTLQASSGSVQAAALRWIEPPRLVDVDAFAVEVMREGWACLAFPPFPDPAVADELLEIGLDEGAPAMLWMRGTGQVDPQLGDQLREHLSVTALPHVPAQLHTLRREAVLAGGTAHCGRHIALLWDDPALLRPPAGPFAAPPRSD